MASLQTYINQTSERYGLTAAQSQALSSAYESGPVREVYNTASALPAVPEGGGSAVLYQGTSPINGLPNYENAAEYIRETPGTFMDNMTPAGQYLSGEAQGTLANAENAINQALSNIGEQNLPLGALSEPAWREVSTNLVTEAESISKVFPSEMPNPNSVFMQNELTTALELHPEIAGIPAEQLRNLPPNELANLFNSGATPVEPLSSERPSLANILAAGGLGVAGILGSIINAAFVGEAKAPERPYDPPQVGTGDPASSLIPYSSRIPINSMLRKPTPTTMAAAMPHRPRQIMLRTTIRMQQTIPAIMARRANPSSST